jgi:uncharacterized protein (DUF4415 family)
MKEKLTKRASSKLLTSAQQAELKALAAMPDNEINTADVPEARDWSRAKRGLFYRPVKRQLTLRIDADVLEWFKRKAPDGRGYQTYINTTLREYVERRDKEDPSCS